MRLQNKESETYMVKGIIYTIGAIITAISVVITYLILRKPVKQYSVYEIRSDR